MGMEGGATAGGDPSDNSKDEIEDEDDLGIQKLKTGGIRCRHCRQGFSLYQNARRHVRNVHLGLKRAEPKKKGGTNKASNNASSSSSPSLSEQLLQAQETIREQYLSNMYP